VTQLLLTLSLAARGAAESKGMDLTPLVLDNLDSLARFRPELVLCAGVLILLVLDLAWRQGAGRRARLAVAALVVLAAAAAFLWLQPPGVAWMFNGMIASDGFATFFKWLFLAAGAVTVVVAALGTELAPERLGEFFALLLAIVLGMFLMASASNLIMMYLGIELVSMTSYVLAGFRKGDRRATEAALKYVIYGGVASGVMLFGMSYLYGLSGTFSFLELGPAISSTLRASGPALAGARLALVAGIVFVTAGVGYKIAAVPFHMWCPDVYEGAPTPFTAFLSVGPKAAGFALALRFFLSVFGSPGAGGAQPGLETVPWPAVIGVMSAVTMTLGNLVAIVQTNLKRLLAYSSIAHAGYLLMGLAAASTNGTRSVLVYLAVYLVMNLGAFVVVMLVASATGSESIQDYRGLVRRLPLAAIAFAVFLLSLTGLPPFAGFIGKWYLFTAVWERTGGAGGGWYAVLLVVAALNTAVSLYYYARIIRAMFLDAPSAAEPSALRAPVGYQLIVGTFAALVIVFGILPQPLIAVAQRALEMLGS
jgi:NADH-quinone oxidoreductase subunit N